MTEFILKKPVYLCGMMGSGKSAAGRILARKLDTDFTDLDDVIEEKLEMPVKQIFKEKGEAFFRRAEWGALRKITLINKIQVVSLGGGSLQNQQVTDQLKISGWLIFLNPPQSVLLERLQSAENRPMLTHSEKNIDQRISELLEKRMPLYKQAHITLNTGGETPGETAEKIIEKLKIYDS